MNPPVSSWLKLHPGLDFGGWDSFTEVYQFYPEGLVPLIGKHNVIRFDISMQDTETLQGVQGHQQLQGQKKKEHVWI